MSLLSRKVDYAILVLFRLMKHDEGASAHKLSDEYGLSRPFIANILKGLCQAGFVESHRGIHGGYRLCRSPDEISIEDIMAGLEGPFGLTTCTTPDMEHECVLTDCCPIRHPLTMVHERLLAVLGGMTLADLAAPALVTLETEYNGKVTHLSRQ